VKSTVFVGVTVLVGVIVLLGLFTASTSSAEDAISRLTDGQAWSADGPMGSAVDISFNPNGTGKVGSGLFTQAFAWEGSGNRICIAGLPGTASGCLDMAATENGYIGTREDGSQMRLWR
jgi:hypothetical protein